MSEEAFLKCACSYCQGRIEFPAHALGITATCPHCGVETRLVTTEPGPPAPPPPPARPALAATPRPSSSPPSPPVTAGPPTTPDLVVDDLTTEAAPPKGGKLKKALTVVWTVLAGLMLLGFFGLKVWNWYRKTARVVEATKGEPKPEESSTATPPPSGTSKSAPMPPSPSSQLR